MYPKPIQRLIELFTKLPGIGPRQATRFAFFILKDSKNIVSDLIESLKEVSENITFCNQCFRSAEKSREQENSSYCSFCRDTRRDSESIAVVEKESDMQNLEKTAHYHGLYHILGGTVSPLDSSSTARLHLKELYQRISLILQKNTPCEVILATNSTTEGDTTALYIERILTPLKEHYPTLKISRLGRGLSLGSELEYVDETTIKNALINRK